ncbi:GNAT family N-acetyltransferase [Dactylosporangium aurantiacum]|uniref:GNAT family N-acetyltransferase n=1 Tax=Dactylosporangium aurantiacum TaxID=35754 RepID=A0A9Q9IN93_9ACTN|nr:GNAT family N-acetyltransferase [Dactylosporangium aurantiacum]MDG6104549.1 GNAT family N-acetyltransferase [Dactylosporangium aurantiacum]UWZ56160.1 GNAT family N-acetyltransferase [Dactylosporangium aurantiacum]
MLDVRTALPTDLPAAVEVWQAANTARGLPPSPDRLARIREKLTAPDATVLVATLPGTPTPASAALPSPPDIPAAGRVPAAGPAPAPLHAPALAPAAKPAPAPTAGPAPGPSPAAGPGSAADHTRVVGMALVEPGRADDGAGAPVPGHGHVSMVFVHPSHWSNGYGRHLLRAVDALGYTRTTLWTRRSNDRAQRLYAAAGYTPTGRTAHLTDGDAIIQLERLTDPSPA